MDISLLNVTDSSNVEDCGGEDDIDNNLYGPQYAHENTQKPLSYNSQRTGCSSNPCLNQGQCYPLSITEYKCSCQPGFSGKNCDVVQDQCSQMPCQNQGVCKQNNTHYTCNCLLGFTGPNCEQSNKKRHVVVMCSNFVLFRSRHKKRCTF